MSVAAGSQRAVTKGTVPFGEYRTWYRVTGELGAGRPAVVVVHGGPGSTHDYLLPLARLAEDGWPVVHYDQLGNGGSTHLPDSAPDFWTVDLFLAELGNLVEELGIADDDPRVNPNGGAIAIGHPLGASGARLALTALRQLERSGGRRALATMCIGVGQGIALAIERA